MSDDAVLIFRLPPIGPGSYRGGVSTTVPEPAHAPDPDRKPVGLTRPPSSAAVPDSPIASSAREVEVFLSSGHTLDFTGDDAPEAATLLDSLATPPASASWGANDE